MNRTREVYRKDTVDIDTGEIVTQVSISKTVIKEGFARMYFTDLGALLQCTKSQVDFLVCAFKLGYIEFNTNELLLTSERKKNVCDCANIKINSLYNCIYLLLKKGVFIKNNKGGIFLNPTLFFYGTDIEREKVLTLKLTYNIE